MDPQMREDDFLLVENEFLLSRFSRWRDLLCSSPGVGHLSSPELLHRLKFVHSTLLFGLGQNLSPDGRMKLDEQPH